jgi:hypothetical protein
VNDQRRHCGAVPSIATGVVRAEVIGIVDYHPATEQLVILERKSIENRHNWIT